MDPARFTRIDETTWQIEPTGAMRVPGIIYADEALIRAMDDNRANRQHRHAAGHRQGVLRDARRPLGLWFPNWRCGRFRRGRWGYRLRRRCRFRRLVWCANDA